MSAASIIGRGIPPPPSPQLVVLAFAGLPDEVVDQLNEVGWLLPFVAVVVPVGLIASLAFAKLSYVVLAIAQMAAIIFGLRALNAHLRREGFTNYQVRMTLIPCYLVACFLTNIAAVISLGIVRKFL